MGNKLRPVKLFPYTLAHNIKDNVMQSMVHMKIESNWGHISDLTSALHERCQYYVVTMQFDLTELACHITISNPCSRAQMHCKMLLLRYNFDNH